MLAFGSKPLNLPRAEGIFIWHTLDQPSEKHGGHAHGCSRFEVIFDRLNPKHRGVQENGLFQPVLPEEFPSDPEYCPF